MDDVERIAASLTKAQRAAILAAQSCAARGVWHPAGVYVSADKRVRYNLSRRKLTTDYLRSSNPLTLLGLAVRAHLSKGAEDATNR